jgi:uncharacterized repeat protein (TIGR02543 family)
MYGGGTTQYWQYNIHLATSPTGIGKVYVINQEKTYENSFSAVNESSSMDFSIEYQDSFAGYIFLGWSEDEPATKPSDIFTKQNPYYFSLNGFDAGKHEGAPSIDSDLKTDFYANFTSLIVESQNKDEGSAVILDSPFQVSLGTEVRIKAIAEAGYKFVGWRRTNVSGVVQEGFASTDNPYCFTTSVETAGTYTAIFEETTEVIAHTVTTEDANHGHLVADHETATAREAVYLTVSSDDGYETTSLKYDNFYADKVSDTRYRFIMPNEHIKISQTCAPITYTIGYNLDGGTVSTANPTQYTIETETITLTNPTKTGYAFAGWKRKGATETVITATIPKGSTRKRFYTAKWTPNTYTVSFDKNADNATGDEMDPMHFTYDEEKTLSLNTFSREGYLFAGWNTKANGSGTAYSNGQVVKNLTSQVSGSVTLYAQWSDKTPDKLYFGDDNDGSADHPYTIKTRDAWNYFCDCLQDNTTYNRFSGKTVKLDADISVSRMAGSDSHDFCGTFDGGGNTLRFTSTENVNGVAPFSYISETTPTGDSVVSHPSIRNLNVVVDINTTATHASGLVGRMWGTLTIEDCTVSGTIQTSAQYATGFIGEQNGAANITDCVSSVTIKSSVNGDGTDGGFVGRTTGTNCITHFKGCLFNGKLLTTNGTNKCGGFVGWNRGTVNVSNSLYAPADPGEGETWADTSGSATFARNGATVSNSYYTTDFNDGTTYTGQGKLVHRIMAGDDVTVAHAGAPTQYATSGITAYKAINASGDSDPFIAGIVYNNVVYAGQVDNVSLTVSAASRAGYVVSGTYASAGTLTGTGNPYSFTMPNEDVTITANYTTINEFPWTENFNGLTVNNSIPSGWDNSEGTIYSDSYKWAYNTSTSGNGSTNGTSHDGSNCVRFNSYSNSSGKTNFLKTPIMNLPQDKVMLLHFWYKNPVGGDFSVYISTDGGATHTTALATGLTAQASWREYFISLEDYVGAENVIIVFKGTSNYANNDAYIYLDDVTVEERSSCMTPREPTVSVSPTSATLNWTEVGTATEWVVAYKATSDNGFTEVIANSHPFTLTGLASATTYTAKIRPVADEEKWSSEIIFTTLVSNPIPTDIAVSNITHNSATISWTGYGESYNVRYCTAIFEEGFENGLGSWTMQNQESSTGIYSTAHSGSKGFRFNNRSNPPQYLMSPELTNVDEDALLEFYYMNSFSNYTETFHVGFSSTTNNADAFTFGEEITASDTQWHLYQVTVPAGTKYICWELTSDDKRFLYIDDIVVKAANWTNANTAEKILLLTGLNAGTNYIYQVQSVKGEEASDWSPYASFTTATVIELADTGTDNATTISENNGKLADVTLSGRTLYKDGAWNTLCLPFDVTLEGSVLEGATAKTLTAATMNGDDLSLTFGNPDSATEPVTVLKAGVPYLIKWNEGTDIVEPTFTGVTINNSYAATARKTVSAADGAVKFIGYYDTFSIDQTNTDIYYMTAQNTLKHTGVARTLHACRAYFQFADEASEARQIRLDFGEDETTGIVSMLDEEGGTRNEEGDMKNGAWYTVDGVKLNGKPTRKGLYIFNGHKVVIK